MKLEKCNLFKTPKTFSEVQDWIDIHSPSERPHLITAAMMVWNLCAELTKDNLSKEEFMERLEEVKNA